MKIMKIYSLCIVFQHKASGAEGMRLTFYFRGDAPDLEVYINEYGVGVNYHPLFSFGHSVQNHCVGSNFGFGFG